MKDGVLFLQNKQQALAHGISQGAISELRGGSFKSGFIGGFLDEKR